MMQHMLTTVDNPFDPFDEFDEWNTWDCSEGYCSLAYLARVVTTSDELSEADQMLDIERGMDDIVANDPLEVYIKLSRDLDFVDRPSELIKED